jgi:hypothetical protein
MLTRSIDELLFTNNAGQSAQLQDVISEGLDGGYEDRIRELVELLNSGTPHHRLLACVALVSWACPEGFQALIQWAAEPAGVPWSDQPVTYDRIYGADDAFELLAEALHVSFWNDETPTLRRMQRGAASVLLKIYPDHFFGRSLALALIRDKKLLATLSTEISAAIEGCIHRLTSGPKPAFDLGIQAAYLLIPLARADDKRAAQLAERMVSQLPRSERMYRELILGLAEGTGSATLEVLKKMKGLGIPAVTADAEKALSRRESQT